MGHSVVTQIEIAAPPSEVRKVFLDTAKYSEWSKNFMLSITPVNGGELEAAKPGDKLKVVLTNFKFDPTVLENTPDIFKWRGSIPGVFTGDHRWVFEPSTTNPEGTKLTQAEDFSGFLSFLAKPSIGWGKKTEAGFDAFNKEVKARAEQLRSQ